MFRDGTNTSDKVRDLRLVGKARSHTQLNFRLVIVHSCSVMLGELVWMLFVRCWKSSCMSSSQSGNLKPEMHDFSCEKSRDRKSF